MKFFSQWKIKQYEVAKMICGWIKLRSLFERLRILKAIPPAPQPEDMQKKVEELTQKIQSQMKAMGTLFCSECNRTTGVKYKYKDGSRGIQLRRVIDGVYVCTECLSKKYGVNK